uniref:Uncharacterized protein n=1 Tax=Panagrolaimus sp. ES5 TaxID=591445 RepID=A0AC34GR83_9BILA
MSISPPSLKDSPPIPLPQHRDRSRSPIFFSPIKMTTTIISPSQKNQPRKLSSWKPLKVGPLLSYREREEMIKAIINRQTSNTYDKFYENLAFLDCWNKAEFQLTAVKTIRNLIFEGKELAKYNKKLKEESEQKDEKIKALEAEIESKVAENDEIKKDYCIMEEQLNSASGQITILEQTIDDFQEELIDAKQDADEAVQECEIIKKRINAEAILLFEQWTKLVDRTSTRKSSTSSST